MLAITEGETHDEQKEIPGPKNACIPVDLERLVRNGEDCSKSA